MTLETLFNVYRSRCVCMSWHTLCQRVCHLLCVTAVLSVNTFKWNLRMCSLDCITVVHRPSPLWRFLLCPGKVGAEYCDQQINPPVCLSVREHISGTAGPIFTNFFADPLWPWRGPPLVVLRYVTVLWMTSCLVIRGRLNP